MPKVDVNRAVLLATVVILVVLTGLFGYRLEIGKNGLTFERAPVAEALARGG